MVPHPTIRRPPGCQSGLVLRVATLNVQNDEGDPRRLGLLADGLRQLAPDVLALQEVVAPGQRETLAAAAGLTHATHQDEVIGPLPPPADRFGGACVLTRWPHRVVAVREHRPADAADVHRWTLAVAVEPPDAGELLLVVPTTPWQPDAAGAREDQAREVLALVRAHPRAVVAGDLNATPDEAGVRHLTRHLTDAWRVAGDGPGHTWPTDAAPDRRRRVDYVLVAPPARVRAAWLFCDRPVAGLLPSDHAGVAADVDLDVTG
jgi:endonuclease/exonuclease/phosphatase family metal-dependent hydrolase